MSTLEIVYAVVFLVLTILAPAVYLYIRELKLLKKKYKKLEKKLKKNMKQNAFVKKIEEIKDSAEEK